MSESPASSMPGPALKALQDLLAVCFLRSEFITFIKAHCYDGVRLLNEVAPDGTAPKAVLINCVVEGMEGRGLIDQSFFDRLVDARPKRKSQIEAVSARMFSPLQAPRPVFANERDRALSEEMDALYEQRAELESTGVDTSLLTDQILGIKRKLREGPELVPGDRLSDRYKLLERCGRGGFATVWSAYDARARSRVAIKVLHGQFADSRERADRFFRGSRFMHQLQHPHIVRVLKEEGQDGGYKYFVMELLSGGDLWKAIQGHKALSRDELLDIIQAVAEALAHAHRQQIIHRDVKPSNILLTREGVAKLTDFDLVRAADTTGGTRTGALGTFIYAAPEAMEDGSRVKASVDVYGLAMTMVAGWIGRRPQPADKYQPDRLVDGLDIPPALSKLLKASLQISPCERPSNAGDFLELLQQARENTDASTDIHLASSSIASPKPIPIEPASSERLVCPDWGQSIARDRYGIFVDVDIPGSPVTFRMRWIEPGDFLMGSLDDEEGRHADEGSQHKVKLTEGFWLADAPCTQAVYEAVIRANPSHFESAARPVENISWIEAQEFLQALNQGFRDQAFQLPTEAQWEFACRAGTHSARYGKLKDIAWYHDNAGSQTHLVRQKAPNAWGLYDMLGNVWEWCADDAESLAKLRRYPNEPETDPFHAGSGRRFRVIRGGAWNNLARHARAAFRNALALEVRYEWLGFRLARGKKRRPEGQ